MRSHTDDDLTGRCPRCWIVGKHCVCAHVPRLETRAEVLVVRHRQEAWKSSNTVRIAGLALPRLTLVEFGVDLAATAAALAPFVDGDGVFLVYPSDTAADWPAASPRRLVFLDGTWRQTRRMLKKLPALAALPRLALPEKATDVIRLRRPTFAGGRATLEAMADAFAMLRHDETAAALDALHARYVEHVLRARGRWDAAHGVMET
jgi:DTW domain-containing protein YfiP